MDNFNLPDFNIDFGNFDPQDICSDETINAVLVIDVSPSINAYVQDLNSAFRDFLAEMQRSHVAEKLMVSVIEFNDAINVRTGFRPVATVDTAQIMFRPCGAGTALYDAVLTGVTNAINYRQNLENSGVNCKTLFFVITDGEDNSSTHPASQVKGLLDTIMATEKNAFSFETILFGVGHAARFELAQKEMGIKHLAMIGHTAQEIRKMIGFISASISQSASGALHVTF